MGNSFREIAPDELKDNPFDLIGTQWMLIAAGHPAAFNFMTASWGSMGVLWDRKVCSCLIRPQRHTFGFVDKAAGFTLSFFGDDFRDVLLYCGTHSGSDVDKVKETGLTPVFDENGGIYFEQARLVIECRKIYQQDIAPRNFIDPRIHDNYPDKDYHRMFVGEILRCLLR